MKETKKTLKWRNLPCSFVRKLNMIKVSVLPRLIYRFNTMPIKIAAGLFVHVNKLILKLTSKYKRTEIAKHIWKRMNLESHILILRLAHTSQNKIAGKERWTFRSVECNRQSRNTTKHIWYLIVGEGAK
jgi:hypothetical protein